MTEEFDNLQRLLRLKRYERPQDMDAFTADLIAKLHVRQREDYLKQSLWSVFCERVTSWFEDTPTPKLALAGVAAAALVVMAAVSWGSNSLLVAGSKQATGVHAADSTDVTLPISYSTSPLFGAELIPTAEGQRTLSPLLLSKHFDGGYTDEVRQVAKGELFENRVKPPFTVMPEIGVMFDFAPEEPEAK